MMTEDREIPTDEESCECQMCNDDYPEEEINSEGMCEVCQGIYDAIEEAKDEEAEAEDELERCNQELKSAREAYHAASRALEVAHEKRIRLERKHGKN